MNPEDLPRETKCLNDPKHKAFRDYIVDSNLQDIWLIACPKCRLIWYDAEAEELQENKQ